MHEISLRNSEQQKLAEQKKHQKLLKNGAETNWELQTRDGFKKNEHFHFFRQKIYDCMKTLGE